MQQQLKFGDGTILPISLSKGATEKYPYQGGARDCIDFQITGDAISYDALDALTATSLPGAAANANTQKLVLITDDQGADGQSIHTEAELDNYTLRAEFGKTTQQISPGSGTTPPTYEERMHVVLAQKTYEEYAREQQAAAQEAQAQAIAELSILVAGGEA